MGIRKRMTATILTILVLGGLLAGPLMSQVETPHYAVTEIHGAIEHRSYSPMVVAEVEVQGKRDEAINGGFGLLADYIFGNNTVAAKIAMTAPVEQSQSRKIAMTAPVEQRAVGDNWQVRFVMPSEYTLQSLPRPNNDRVQLRELPGQTVIAITFSGRNSDDNVARHERELLAYARQRGLQIDLPARYAFYNPPWTLPIMRRNEVLVTLRE